MKRLFTLLLFLPVAIATSYKAFTLEELYTRADYVLYGTVENATPTRTGTEVTLHEHVVLLGDETIDTLTWNGSAEIAGRIIPAAGARILAFAYTNTEGYSPIVGFSRGLFTEVDGSYVNADGAHIALSIDNELSVTMNASDAADAAAVREALAAPTFMETDGVAERPADERTVPDTATDAVSANGAEPENEIHEVSLPVAANIHTEPAFTRAVTAWNDALSGRAKIITEVSDNPVIIAGDAAELGDAVSVTYRTDGRLVSEVNVRSSDALVFNAFLVEIGVHAGAQPGTSPAVTAALPAFERTVGVDDAEAILTRAAFLPGDINQDGVVDFLDLILLAAQHGERGINLLGDLNNDGVVDDADVAILREHYSFTAPEKP